MTADAEIPEAEIVLDEPGVYDIPEYLYHADPVPGGSLSASGAKLLLPPSCPALYAYRRDHPKTSAAFDFGTAAHLYVLGAGPLVEVIDADDWRTRKAQDARKEARANGAVAMLRGELDEVEAMSRAIWGHPLAAALLGPGRGDPEQSLFWQDDDAGIWRRARLDYLPRPGAGRMIIPDYKTCDRADRESVRKAIANYGYFIQAAQYTDGVRALGLDDDPAFVFIFQEKTPPYLVNVVQLDDEAMEAGRQRMRLACEMFRGCTETGIWPGYCDYNQDPDVISLPPWVARPLEDS